MERFHGTFSFLLAAPLADSFSFCPDIREWSAQMLYVENDRDLVAAVSRALGESRRLVRHRGFQLIEIVVLDGDRARQYVFPPNLTRVFPDASWTTTQGICPAARRPMKTSCQIGRAHV